LDFGKWPQSIIKWDSRNLEDRLVQFDDIEVGGAGVRAQALERDGKLVDDFRIVEAERMVHVLNAPSPAATASLSIGKTISKMVINRYNEEVNYSK
jgi:L-2-hydroxyglutarate oxidase LhgO